MSTIQKIGQRKLNVTFYYDVVSPYSYLAFLVFQRYSKVWNCKVDYKPFFLGAVMKLSSNTSPGLKCFNLLFEMAFSDLRRS